MIKIESARMGEVRARPMARTWLPLLATVLLWAVLYRHPVAEMFGIWMRSDTFAHGLIVLPMSVWLAWRTEFWQSGLPPRPSLAALSLILPSGALWLAGVLASTTAAVHVGTVGLLVGALWGALGNRLAWKLAFPLAFLFFAPPVGEFLVPVLMSQTAEFTVRAIRMSGVPVYQEGLHFVLPNGTWSVVEACSGIRYLIASLMVGTLYAYLTYTRPLKRALFIGVALLVPIVANWARAYLIVMIGYLSDNKLAAGVDHLIYGWVFFGIVVLAMFWFGSIWRDEPGMADAKVETGPLLPLKASPAVLAGVVLALVLPAIGASLLAPVDRPVEVRLKLPSGRDGWIATDGGGMGYVPNLSGYRALARQVYRKDGETVLAWAALYAHQVNGRELVSWSNRILPARDGDREWIRLAQGSRQLSAGSVKFARLRGPEGDVDVYHWYVIAGRAVGSDLWAKLALGAARLSGASDAAYYLVLATPSDGGLAAQRRIEDFLRAQGEALAGELRRAAEAVE